MRITVYSEQPGITEITSRVNRTRELTEESMEHEDKVSIALPVIFSLSNLGCSVK
jgi:hypothetical protein